MASHEEMKNALRRILYITVFLFVIFGLTSIGILVDAARKDQPVTLTTALVLLSILLAFLVIFVIVIWLWRRVNQRHRWRLERDEESRYIRGENGERYLRTATELKELKRVEKKERKQRDRQREIQDAIATAKNRIDNRKISLPKDPRDLKTGQRMERVEAPFVPTPDPIFGHGTHGLFGARPAMGGGLNPNHGLSPPTSSTPPLREIPKEAEQRRRELKTASVEEAAEVKDGREGGKEKTTTPAKRKPAALGPSCGDTSPHNIMRKEVGTPPKGDRGALAGPNGLRVVNGSAEDSENGVVVGIGGEKIDGLRSHKVPSGIVGHGLIAIPPLVKATTVPVMETNRWSTEREERRRANGWQPPSEKWDLNAMSEKEGNRSRRPGESKKSWKDMSADEIEAEIKREKNKDTRATTRGQIQGTTRIPTPRSGKRSDAQKAAEKSERERCIFKSEKQKMRARLNEERAKVAAATTRVREEEEREGREWTEKQTEEVQRELNGVEAVLPTHALRPRKSSETYPMPHLSAIPHRLKPQQAQQKAKDEVRKYVKPTLEISKSAMYGYMHNVEAVHCPPETCTYPTVSAPASSSYNPYIAYKPTLAVTKVYQSPRVEEVNDSEDETEWQRKRREQEESRREEEESARLAVMQAFTPSPPQPSSLELPSPLHRPKSPAGTFSDWHNLYKAGAKERRVTGFTCTTSTTEAERNESFDTFSQVMKEREETAKKRDINAEVGVARTFRQMGGVEHPTRLAIPNMSPTEPKPADEGKEKDVLPNYIAADDARVSLAKLNQQSHRHHAIDTLPSQQNFAQYRTADEAQAAILKLSVVSLHSTERGTTFSSFIPQPGSSAPAKSTPVKDGKSGIPRLAPGSGGTLTSGARVKPLPGQFGYNNARKANIDLTPKRNGDA